MPIINRTKPNNPVSDNVTPINQVLWKYISMNIMNQSKYSGLVQLLDLNTMRLLHCCRETEKFLNKSYSDIKRLNPYFLRSLLSPPTISKLSAFFKLQKEQSHSEKSFSIISYIRKSNDGLYNRYISIIKPIKSAGLIILISYNLDILMNININLKELISVVNKSSESSNNNLKLTSREFEILDLTIKGLTNKTIAESLYISPLTVKTHKQNIYKKLKSNNLKEISDLMGNVKY